MLHARGRPAFDADGRLVRVVGTVFDCTEDVARQTEVERARQLLDLSQRIARSGTFVWDPVTDTAEWSRGLSEVLGVDEPLSSDAFVEMLHPEDLPAFAGIREIVREKQMAGPVQFRARRPDGEWRTFVTHVISTADPELTPHIGVIQDVTERAQLEQQLRVSETLKSIGRFAAGVAHDFNNLMTVMLTSAEELARERPDDRLDQIVTAVHSGADLVQRLLSVGRRGPSQPRPIDLTATIRDMSTWAHRILGDDVSIAFELLDRPVSIVADPAELHQVLLNLFANARDAMPDGGTVTVRTEVEGERVRLRVMDEGPGMAPDVMARAFDPFFTTKSVGEGSGIGLAMVNSVIVGLGGTVSLESPPEGGSEVRIELPMTATSVAGERADEPVAKPKGLGTILVVEDNEHVRRVTARTLARHGHTVLVANGPEEAADILASQRPDVVLTDVSMPGGGGRRVAELAAELQSGVPVMFMTGYDPKGDLRGRVLRKPFLPRELLAAVAEELG